jgi:NADPH:quinone reductase
MRSIAVDKLGGTPRLMILADPKPAVDEIIIQVRAAGINPIDWKLADGLYDGVMANTLPFVLGIDVTGQVVAMGANVSRFQLGDRVFGQSFDVPLGRGSYAEFMPLRAKGSLCILPGPLADEVGAALPTAAMTALALIDSIELPPGSKILIVGATGGVGSFVVQLAAGRGFTVLATAGKQDAARIQGLGAAETYEPRSNQLIAQIVAAHEHGIDALVDLVSDAKTFKRYSELVVKNGYAFTTVGVADPGHLRRTLVRGGSFSLRGHSELLQRLARLVERRELTVPIESTIGLDDVPAALEASRAGHARGKTVIRFG